MYRRSKRSRHRCIGVVANHSHPHQIRQRLHRRSHTLRGEDGRQWTVRKAVNGAENRWVPPYWHENDDSRSYQKLQQDAEKAYTQFDTKQKEFIQQLKEFTPVRERYVRSLEKKNKMTYTPAQFPIPAQPLNEEYDIQKIYKAKNYIRAGAYNSPTGFINIGTFESICQTSAVDAVSVYQPLVVLAAASVSSALAIWMVRIRNLRNAFESAIGIPLAFFYVRNA